MWENRPKRKRPTNFPSSVRKRDIDDISKPNKKLAWTGTMAHIASLLVAAIVGAVGVKIADNIPHFWVKLSSPWREPTCENPKGLEVVTPSEATASSALPPTDTNIATFSFDANLTIDDDTGTAWAEGAPEWGTGERLKLILPATRDVQLLCVINGYPLEEDLFWRNGRVESFNVRTASGERLDSRLPDATKGHIETPQKLDIPPGPTNWIELEINKVYKAKGQIRYKDTTVAEVKVYSAK
ncbi:NADase-type glycan-binding domain-containing protein [Nocardia sp. NPDC047654]|uniref:NADase-type glycan-binding domain-containing protein n=1 Tax=Nocardia sp. NPDC047654 TaxID=3364314 RepID=UPI003718FB63